MKELAIIMLDWNGAEDTAECLDSLNNYDLYDIYLLDNGSEPENSDKLHEYFSKPEYWGMINEVEAENLEPAECPLTYIVSEENLGFARGNNFVAGRIFRDYRYVLLLNNDTFVPEGTIEHMLKTAKKRGTVALTCDIRSYYKRNELWNSGGYFTAIGERKYYSQKTIDKLIAKGVKYINAPFITGCAMLIRTDHIAEHGLFTDKFFHGEEDFNFCYKLSRANKKVGVDLGVTLYHKVGRTIDKVGDTDKEYSKMLVHYANRVIDFKEFKSKAGWRVWRKAFLSGLFALRTAKGMKPRQARLLCKRLYMISDKYDGVNKALFDKIMKLKW